MVKNIAVFAEGPTEWYVIWRLCDKGILTQAELMGFKNRNNIGRWLKNLNDLTSVFENFPPEINGVLLVYDQETEPKPEKIWEDLKSQYNLQPHPNNPKLFNYSNSSIPIALHFSDRESPDGNRDFDGYILEIIRRGGEKLIEMLFQDEKTPAYLRERMSERQIQAQQLHILGTKEIADTMQKTNWPPFRSKTNMYAFGTALQLNRSHVWLAEKIVEVAPNDLLQEVFTSLIKTWHELVESMQ